MGLYLVVLVGCWRCCLGFDAWLTCCGCWWWVGFIIVEFVNSVGKFL